MKVTPSSGDVFEDLGLKSPLKAKKRPGKWERKYKRLQGAVVKLYIAAVWHPDVPVEDEGALWEGVRDAAGITTGMKSALFGMGEREE